jgi:hypothetical protein
MPKYYFDLMGKHVMRDRAGVEFSSDAAASREAILRGTDHRHPEACFYSDFESILVRGTGGAIICAAPIRYRKRLAEAPPHL